MLSSVHKPRGDSWHLQMLWCATHGSPGKFPKVPLFSDNLTMHPSKGRTVLGSPQAHLPLGDWTTPFMIKWLRTWIWVWILPTLYTLTSIPHTLTSHLYGCSDANIRSQFSCWFSLQDLICSPFKAAPQWFLISWPAPNRSQHSAGEGSHKCPLVQTTNWPLPSASMRINSQAVRTADLQHALTEIQGRDREWDRTGLQIGISRRRFYEPNSCISLHVDKH